MTTRYLPHPLRRRSRGSSGWGERCEAPGLARKFRDRLLHIR